MRPHGEHARPRRIRIWAVLVPIVGLLAGTLFASTSRAVGGTALRGTISGLPDLIRTQTKNNQAATERLARLESTIDSLTRSDEPDNAAVKSLTEQADRLAVAAGRTAVRGPALKVALDDAHLSTDQIPAGFGVDDVVVHQQDVQGVVNALWAGGAEAMMLQDQRVIATSAVRCVGNTLILQGRVYSPPYVIRAIGDVAGMEESLARDTSVQVYKEYVRAVGLGFEVTEEREATFPAYEGSIRPNHARVTT